MEAAPKKKKGRAAYQPSADQRALVARKAAVRVEQADIAALLGVSVPTLRKHFADELRTRLEPENLFTAPSAGVSPEAGYPVSGQTDPVAPLSLPVQPAPKKPRAPRADGRKRWEPTTSQREEARLLLAGGITLATIAARFSVSEPTARRAFRDLIASAYEAEMATLLVDMRRAARNGNVTAMTKLSEALKAAELDRVSSSISQGANVPAANAPTPSAQREPKVDDIGKKAAALREAHETAMSPEVAGLLGYTEPTARPN